MQETKPLKAADGKTVLVEVNSRTGNTLGILCIHGLTSQVHTHMWYNMANTWPQKGYDTWRVALYPGGGPDFRQLRDVTWEQNLSDIRLALEEMLKVYKKVFIIGHSLGATLALEVIDERVAALVLWDPPYEGKIDAAHGVGPELNPNFYTLDWGNTFMLSKAYAHDLVAATEYKKKYVRVPTFMTRSSSSTEGWSQERVPAEQTVIANSDHSFHKEGNEAELFKVTLEFLKKH